MNKAKITTAFVLAGAALGSGAYVASRPPSYACQVKVGSEYASRGGHKIQINDLKKIGDEPIRGVIREGKFWRGASWSPEGKFTPPFEEADDRDIVCPAK